MTEKAVRKQRVGQIGETILLTVAAVGVMSIAVLAPNALQILKPFLRKKKYSHKQAISRNIESLIRGGLLKRTFDAKGNPSLALTKRGVWESMLRGQTSKTQQKWDGIWRIVIFDVPYAKRKIRDELRKGIRMYGFYQLQQSVWVYPYPCDEFITLLKKHLTLEGDVLVIEAKHIEGERELRREFELPL